LNQVVKYFVFTVLPFGLKSSAYIFSKVLRPLVKFWRSQSIKLVLYLDDGFGVSDHLQLSSRQAIQVKSDLMFDTLLTKPPFNKSKIAFSTKILFSDEDLLLDKQILGGQFNKGIL
jgi:hypothetical protein